MSSTERRPHWIIDRQALWDIAGLAGLEPVTAANIADALHIAPSTLSRVLTGKSEPGADLLARLRHRFGAAAYDRIVRLADDEPETVEQVGAAW